MAESTDRERAVLVADMTVKQIYEEKLATAIQVLKALGSAAFAHRDLANYYQRQGYTTLMKSEETNAELADLALVNYANSLPRTHLEEIERRAQRRKAEEAAHVA